MASKTFLLFAVVLAGVCALSAQALLLKVSVNGTVPCSIGTSINPTLSPVFPNAAVELRRESILIGTTTTNSNGRFSLVLTVQDVLFNPPRGWSVVVTTPLSVCNPALPETGTLRSDVFDVGVNADGTLVFTANKFSYIA